MLRRVDPALSRRLFYPGVAAVLAAQSARTVSAMPVASCTALSERPPLLGVSCAKDSSTLRTARRAKAFSVCLLGREHVAAVSDLASRKGREGRDKLAEAGLGHRKGTKSGAPIILEADAALECRLVKAQTTGDHVLLIGRIESAMATSDFKEYWGFKSYEPMLYSGWAGRMKLYSPVNRKRR